jgi:hypothetical protein
VSLCRVKTCKLLVNTGLDYSGMSRDPKELEPYWTPDAHIDDPLEDAHEDLVYWHRNAVFKLEFKGFHRRIPSCLSS